MSNILRRILVLHEDVQDVLEYHNGQSVCVRKDKKIYLDITGDDNYGRVALSILKGRFGKPNKKFSLVKPTSPEPCSITESQWNSMSHDDENYESIKEIIDKSSEQHRIYINRLNNYKAILTCIEKADIRLAPALLEQRRNQPNEGYEIVFVYDSYYILFE